MIGQTECLSIGSNISKISCALCLWLFRGSHVTHCDCIKCPNCDCFCKKVIEGAVVLAWDSFGGILSMTIGVTHHHPTCLRVPNIWLKRGLKRLSFPITVIGFQKTERMIGSHVISKGVTATVFTAILTSSSLQQIPTPPRAHIRSKMAHVMTGLQTIMMFQYYSCPHVFKSAAIFTRLPRHS